MKKIFIFLMACSLLTACNNKKPNERERTNSSRDRDDYRNDDRNSDKNDDRNSDDNNRDKDNYDNTNNRNDDNSSNNDRTNSGSSDWTSKDRNEFVTSCVNSAVSGGMDQSLAQRYCDCMQVKLERMYPSPNDAANIDVNSSEMQTMMKACLR